MSNQDLVRSVYPDAILSKYYIYGEWYMCIHSYHCGELLDQDTVWGRKSPPISEDEAWERAAKYVNDEFLRKLGK